MEVPAPNDPTPNVVPGSPTVPGDPTPAEAPDLPSGPSAPEPVDPGEPIPAGPEIDNPDPKKPGFV